MYNFKRAGIDRNGAMLRLLFGSIIHRFVVLACVDIVSGESQLNKTNACCIFVMTSELLLASRAFSQEYLHRFHEAGR
jgi:hypothetical protein